MTRAVSCSSKALLARRLLRFSLTFLALAISACGGDANHGERPNIVIILVDDLGFGDLSLFGSEIPTPNIDALAKAGMLMTDFAVAPTCSPTRAMLLSGTDNHIAGLGSMLEERAPNQAEAPGYEGYLHPRVAAMPELFQDAGYATYMTGKWHLGLTPDTGPAARGFDKSFAMLQGGAGAFADMAPIVGPGKAKYLEDGHPVDTLPEDFYSTKFYTERMIEYIEGGRESGKPFFAYLAHTSPHWPLQAPAESIARHAGRYDDGYDVLLERRLQGAIANGLVPEGTEPFPRPFDHVAWSQLTPEQRKYEARIMEIYAAMVDDLDRYIGVFIDYLKATDEYDNTLIFFASDNGPEAHDLTVGWQELVNWLKVCCDNSYENAGREGSYLWYDEAWGQAGNTPMRMYKGYTSQGGVRVPAFVHWPSTVKADTTTDAFLTVKDVLPTMLEAAGIAHPGNKKFRGRRVEPIQGRSMMAVLSGQSESIRTADDYMGWELFGKRAIRKGPWKAIYLPAHELRDNIPAVKTNTWQLYNLDDDPSEMNDLAAAHPEKLAELAALWGEYVKDNGVVLPDFMSGY